MGKVRIKIKFPLTVNKWICRPNQIGKGKIRHNSLELSFQTIFLTTDNNLIIKTNPISARSYLLQFP